MAGRSGGPDPLADFMADVAMTARKALRNSRKREKEEERRLEIEARLKSNGVTKAKHGKRGRRPAHGPVPLGSSSNPGSPRLQSPEWDTDVSKLKQSLNGFGDTRLGVGGMTRNSFDVSGDGLTVTMHRPNTEAVFDPKRSELPTLVMSKSTSAITAPAAGRAGGGMALLTGPSFPKVQTKFSASAGEELPKGTGSKGFIEKSVSMSYDERYKASPFALPIDPAMHLRAMVKGSKSSGITMARRGQDEERQAQRDASQLVSATDGLKRAILSGSAVVEDGVLPTEAMRTELQGLTSWSGKDLGIKYRGEEEREAAWRAYMQAAQASQEIHSIADAFFATAKIARHPLYVMLDRIVAAENERSLIRARGRASMRRFVLDVHQIWLSNIEHIREHRLASLSDEARSSQDVPPPRALVRSRDVEGITAVRSQIQSVWPPRAWQSLPIPVPLSPVHTTSGPKTTGAVPAPPELHDLPAEPLAVKRLLSAEPIGEGKSQRLVSIDRLSALDDRDGAKVLDKLQVEHVVEDGSGDGGVESAGEAQDARQEPAGEVTGVEPGGQGDVEQTPKDEQDGPASHFPALWRVQAYSRLDGSLVQAIVAETAALKALDLDQGVASGGADESTAVRGGKPLADIPAIRGTLVYRCSRRLTVVGQKHTFYIQVHVLPHTPGEAAKVLLVARGATSFKKRPRRAVLPVVASTIFLKALLGLPDAPVLDHSFWLDLGAPRWKELVSHLVIQTLDQEPSEAAADGPTAPEHVLGQLRLRNSAVLDPNYSAWLCEAAYQLLPMLEFPQQPEEANGAKGSGQKKPKPSKKKLAQPPVVAIHGVALEGPPDEFKSFELAVADQWQDRTEWGPEFPSSMQVSGFAQCMRQVPGSSVLGSPGLWFSYLPYGTSGEREFTRVVGLHERGASTDTVLVRLLLALDTPLLAPSLTAWNRAKIIAASPPPELSHAFIPSLVKDPRLVQLCNQLESALDGKRTVPIWLLTDAEDALDFAVIPRPYLKRGGLRSVGYRRHWPSHNQDRFRMVANTATLFPQAFIPPRIFGLTMRGALPNATKCGNRHIYLSEEYIQTTLTRMRDASDYTDVSKMKHHQGANDPSVFTLHLQGRACILNLDELQQYVDTCHLAVNLEDVALDELRALTVDKALALGWAREDSVKLVEKIDAIRSRTAHETKWTVEYHYIARGGMSTFVALLEEKERLRREEEGQREIKAKLEAARRLLEAKLELQRKQREALVAERLGIAHGGAGDDQSLSGTVSLLSGGDAALLPGPGGAAGTLGVELLATRTAQGLGAVTPQQDQQDPRATLEIGQGGENMSAESYSRPGEEDPFPLPSDRHHGAGAGDEGSEDGMDEFGDLEELDEQEFRRIVQYLATDRDLLRMLAEQLGMSSEVVDELEVAADEADRAEELADQARGGGTTSSSLARSVALRHDSVALMDELLEDERAFSQPPVPPLTLKPAVELDEDDVLGVGWRRLHRTKLKGFIQNAKATHTQGCKDSAYNTVPELRTVGLMDPVDGIEYTPLDPGFPSGGDSMFIADVLKDTVRQIDLAAERKRRAEMVAEGDASSQLDLISKAMVPVPSVGEVSSEERILMEVDEKEKKLDLKARMDMQLLKAAKAGNVENCVDAIEQAAFVDVEDDHGNTALILAAQQGSKKLVKALLRQGADIHHQNHSGNTVLHYCYEYNHRDLADYFLTKGADDALLNEEGLTCYEGIHRATMA